MKRILIITYYWPPSAGSGVQRWLKFSKYLPEFGWQPLVYTPEDPDFSLQDSSLLEDIPQECEVIKRKIWEPYSLYRKINRRPKGENINFGTTKSGGKETLLKKGSVWVRGNLFIPDPRVFWVKPSVRFLKKYLKKNPVDAFVTTGPPHSMHLIGLGIKKHFPDLKWIVDMRDPWATFDILNSFNLNQRSKAKHNHLEKLVLDTADSVVMVSPSMHEEFQPFDLCKQEIITNGYDEDDFKQTAKSKEKKDQAFKIYHAGLLNYIRNPEPFWEALTELCKEDSAFDKQLQVELIGNVDQFIISQIKNHPVLSKKINIRSWMKHEDILKEYQKADLLLLLVNKSRNAKAQIPGKVFEYLAVNKPILHIGRPDADVAHILEETKSGITCGVEDKEAIKTAILHYFKKFKEREHANATNTVISPYSRRNLTKKLVEKVLGI